MKRILSILGILVFLSATAVLAQQSQMQSVAEIHINRIKPGMQQQYEAGRKKHMAWHRSQNDAWPWYVWEVLTGEGTGSYVVGTFGHNWKDFDGRQQFQTADSADANANMGPTLAGEEQSYYILRRDLSQNPDWTQPTPLLSVTHFMLAPEGINDFTESVKKVNEGLKKANAPVAGPSRWYQLANGGETPHYVLVGDRTNWAAFQPPTDKTLDSIMEDAYGKEQGAAILSTLRKAIRKTYTEALQYRPDLSYNPGK